MKHYTKKGEPVSCPRCNSSAFNFEDRGAGHFAIYCDGCFSLVGYKIPGGYDEHFRNHHDRRLRRALRDLWRALRSLARTTWRYARGRV